MVRFAKSGGPIIALQKRYRFVHPEWRAGYGEEFLRAECGGLALSFSHHLAASLSAHRNCREIVRIDNGRKRNNLRDNIFAVTQMLEIVGLSCFYKTNNLHRFHTETSYHLVLRLSKTSKYATRKYINILTPGMPPNSFSHSSDCKVCARVGDLRFWIADFGL